MKAVVLVIVLACTLAGCGKKGPPSAPGPAQDIIYPKQYPAY